MNRFLSKATAAMTPYTPGEQPQDQTYIKLNTNESPFPPSPEVQAALRDFDADDLRLYPDPDSAALTRALAAYNKLAPDQALAFGGSDEALAYAFMAFSDRGDRVYFPDITYGFYQVYADLFGLEAVKIPLAEDFTVCIEDYFGVDGNIFLANPNAPTGIALRPEQIEEILRHNPDRLVVIDEAYVDFAPGCTCVSLIGKYDNLLVIQTFSKSRSLAGMRLGAAYGQPELMDGLNRIKYSFNPYNLDRVSVAVGLAALSDKAYFKHTTKKIIEAREYTRMELMALGFTVLPSDANFLFISHPSLSGGELYAKLKADGILVRHFNKERIDGFVRVTVGYQAEMHVFLRSVMGYKL
jgi:histidinol-phosphate aminotransferase